MKRSGQVALVLMGVSATTAAGAYMLPSRAECRPQPAVSAPVPGATGAMTQDPCRSRSSSHWGSWHWGSGSSSSASNTGSRPASLSTALSPGAGHGVGTSAGSSTTTSRGGFGATGHAMSGHSSGS